MDPALAETSLAPRDTAAVRSERNAGLKRALDGLWMAYQPIVRWPDRTVHAYEALMRTTDRALASPRQLLDVAEAAGQLLDVGRRVRRLVALSATQLDFGPLLFVNLHPRDLLDDALYSGEAPLSGQAHRAVLEITERVSLEHIPDARERIQQLRLLGYHIAVDDVGSGFAGLASVAELEPDIVKVDMSLVRNVDRERVKRRLLAGLLDACRDLGIEVIAEGVETARERDTLAEMGCELMQGYLFARPGPAFPAPAFV